MKRTKRLLSTLLALCMVLAMLPATAMASGTTDPTPTHRYTVLVLDHSGSMSGEPMKRMQEAANLFCRTVAGDQSHGIENLVAIVGFSSKVDAVQDFTKDITLLQKTVNDLYAGGTTDIAGALAKADELLKDPTLSADAIKNIVLLSDGLPEGNGSLANGRYTGKFTSWGVGNANKCYATVEASGLLMSSYHIYTLGFFHQMDREDRALCRELLTDFAHGGTFYEISNVNQVVVILGNFILDDINNTTPDAPPDPFDPDNPYLYIQFACPVEVTVRRSGSSDVLLNSATDKKTSGYGMLEKTVVGTNNNKINLMLNPNFSYYITMTGVAEGAATITASYVSNGTATPLSIPTEPIPVENGSTDVVLTTRVTDANSYPGVYPPNWVIPEETLTDTPSHFTFVPTTVGGTVVLSKRNAEPGDWVNVYVTPDEGYKLESLTVTDMRGWPVTLREMGENAFSFTMPNARINVNPVFVKVEADDDPYSTNVPTTIPNIEGTSPNYGNMVINTAAMNYSDVNAGDWFYNNVKFCHERYLLNKTGEADGKFEPNTASTRATVWTALSRLAGRNTVTQGDNWYDRAQIWAKGKGITDGERPMDSMTREEFVTMLWRYDGNKYVQNSALGQFNDGESVSWWATEAVKWAVATGLLNGSNGSLNPQSNVTRAEVAAVLQRYVQNVH